MTMKHAMSNSNELVSVVESQQVIINDLLEILPANHDLLNSFKSDLDSISLESVRILVYGKIACGKSQLINAIHGYKLAPSRHSSIIPPSIAEYKSGADDKAILYPTSELHNNVTTPFQIQLDEIKTYLSICDKNDSIKKESPFEKFEKLELYSTRCKVGLNLIDVTLKSWDMSELLSRIANGNLSKIDTVVYCMRADSAYSATDKYNIEILRSLGYTSIVFVLTFWDTLLFNDEIMGTNDAQTVKEWCLKILAPLTDLGERGIFFVDSSCAIEGKINNDHELIEKSGILQLDRHIDNLIMNHQKAVISKITSINKTLTDILGDFIRICLNIKEKNVQLSYELCDLIDNKNTTK